MLKQYVYKFPIGKKSEGSIRVLKPGVDFQQYLKKLYDKGIMAIKIDAPPALDECEDVIVEAVDGCRVEPDGICEHGFPSVLRVYGLI